MSTSHPLNMIAAPDIYRARRARLAESLSRPVVLFAGHAPARNYASNPHPFRAGSTYLYYGGPPLEGAAWVIEPNSDGNNGCTLVRTPPAPDDALWIGQPVADETIIGVAGIDQSCVADPQELDTLVGKCEAAFIAPPCPVASGRVATLGLRPANPEELLAIIHMRLIKDKHELAAMRSAAYTTVVMHRAAMAATRPDRREADAAAAMHLVLVANQSTPSFTPIATVRGEILHNQVYPNRLTDGALMLVDAGAEEPGGYASDVTRTFPVNGKWTNVQKHLYNTVLNSMRRAIAACVPGKRYREVHDLAAEVLCHGLVEAELLKGNPADLVERKAHTLFFPHGVGHLIGLDVHDMEDFGDLAGYAKGRQRRPAFGDKYLRLDRDLEAGLCVTIEPGIYFVPAIWEDDELVRPHAEVINRRAVDALLNEQFGGIRIEESVHVQHAGADGPEVLTEALPSDADEVAACVGRA